jgi:hypothetical protein
LISAWLYTILEIIIREMVLKKSSRSKRSRRKRFFKSLGVLTDCINLSFE